ncbi:unnamed protein product [Ceratitis capitata]|uniref:(Mediterranean fruit fly) hypothetical protein n=1 Tax=Ceratitis capitata TaxID=7213 RepID=A0A811UY89_CERCA|nr:unnamed protein product [Ceratitis capitata]
MKILNIKYITYFEWWRASLTFKSGEKKLLEWFGLLCQVLAISPLSGYVIRFFFTTSIITVFLTPLTASASSSTTATPRHLCARESNSQTSWQIYCILACCQKHKHTHTHTHTHSLASTQRNHLPGVRITGYNTL